MASQAQCNATAGFGWANNSLHQDPCTVASYMGGACISTGTLTIPALGPQETYSGPPLSESQNSCLCSSVYYSLLMCCSLCQNRDTYPWDAFKQNCSTVYISTFQHAIPAGTKVPAWAYENVTIYNGFNATVAEQESALPESTPVPSQTAAAPAGSASSHKSNAGAIAGGTVGGIVFLALVAGAIFLFIRRRRSVASHSNAIPEGPSPAFYAPSTVYTPPKLYDPSDPSTFPPSSTDTPSLYTSMDQSDRGFPPTRHYTGAAEI